MATHGQLAGLALVGLLAGCGGPSPAPVDPAGGSTEAIQLPQAPGDVVARVGAGFVTVQEFADAAGATPGADGSMTLEQRKEVLDGLVTEEVLFMEAVELGLVRDPKVRKVLVNLLLRQEVLAKVTNADFTDEELREYYDAHTADFVLPEKLQVKRILVSFEKHSKEDAEAIIRQARKRVAADPASFREVAEELSEDVYARRGGDLGFLPREGKPGIDTKVAEMAFSLKIGELSEPFEADGGLNIVLPTNRREAVERTFEQMRGSVLRKLRSERYQQDTERYVAALKAQAPLNVDEAALMGVEIKERPLLDLPELDEHGHGEEDEAGEPLRPPGRPGARGGKAPLPGHP